ncbi:hypothetical protein C5167_009300 [Papaver somniferum]|uniref:Uncharacterized protein n=1 Tax=Papaver somniferum TaxID=3469 RepID=A0A4Y7JYF3_PAPSO|nr:hypothetical protein C5167_009300 [Papaver somniferum]
MLGKDVKICLGAH